MIVEIFKPFTANELIGQLNTGIQYISNTFSVEEPTKDIESDAVEKVLAFFALTNIQVSVNKLNGYTILTAIKNC
nr:hypothetical protein [uncultured Acinetobacter sp.]